MNAIRFLTLASVLGALGASCSTQSEQAATTKKSYVVGPVMSYAFSEKLDRRTCYETAKFDSKGSTSVSCTQDTDIPSNAAGYTGANLEYHNRIHVVLATGTDVSMGMTFLLVDKKVVFTAECYDYNANARLHGMDCLAVLQNALLLSMNSMKYTTVSGEDPLNNVAIAGLYQAPGK